MEENVKLNKKLVIEKALPNNKKKSVWPLILFIFLLCGVIVFAILEKLNYIDYLDFI